MVATQSGICADRIYINRENRHFCMRNGIRLQAKPLGRPPKEPRAECAPQAANQLISARRNEVEGFLWSWKRKLFIGSDHGKTQSMVPETTIFRWPHRDVLEKVLEALLRLLFCLISGLAIGVFTASRRRNSEGYTLFRGAQSHRICLAWWYRQHRVAAVFGKHLHFCVSLAFVFSGIPKTTTERWL